MKIDYCPFCGKKLTIPARSKNPETLVKFECPTSGNYYLPGFIFEYAEFEKLRLLNYAYNLYLKTRNGKHIDVAFSMTGCKKKKLDEKVAIVSLDDFNENYPKTQERLDKAILDNLIHLAKTDINNRIFDDEITPRLLYAENIQEFQDRKNRLINERVIESTNYRPYKLTI